MTLRSLWRHLRDLLHSLRGRLRDEQARREVAFGFCLGALSAVGFFLVVARGRW